MGNGNQIWKPLSKRRKHRLAFKSYMSGAVNNLKSPPNNGSKQGKTFKMNQKEQ